MHRQPNLKYHLVQPVLDHALIHLNVLEVFSMPSQVQLPGRAVVGEDGPVQMFERAEIRLLKVLHRVKKKATVGSAKAT